MSRYVKRVIDRFQKSLVDSINHHQRLMSFVSGQKKQASFENTLVEQFVLSFAVQWEAFVNDLIITYVADNPKQFLSNLQARISQSNDEKFGIAVGRRVHFERPKNLTLQSAQQMLAPHGFNITAYTADSLEKKAEQYMTARHAKKFSFGVKDRVFVDFVRALRNYLSHMSDKSRTALLDSLNKLEENDSNSPLSGEIRSIGPYLRYTDQSGTSRAVYIANRMRQISEKLR